MPSYIARTQWKGSFEQGEGQTRVGSEAFQADVAAKTSRGEITNPEELLGSALASCYGLMLVKLVGEAGHEPKSMEATATVDLHHGDSGPSIPRIGLSVTIEAEGLTRDELRELSQEAESCPVSKALAATEIDVEAKLAHSK